MQPAAARQSLALLRTVVGAGAWATPALAGTLFGLKPRKNPQAPYLSRLFGVRDVALAASVMHQSGEARRYALQVGIACDVADAAVALIGARAGYLSAPTAAVLFAPAAAAVALGTVALREPPAA